jgi:bleomycin hydrolase
MITFFSQSLKGRRCWLFAGLNLLRCNIRQKGDHLFSKLKNFEFSQSYLFFYDKLERSNLFLEYMWNLGQKTTDTDDRNISILLHSVCNDGGQWHMFVNLVEKYGVVPAKVMPDRHGASTAKHMNLLLKQVLRQAARDIFDLIRNTSPVYAKVRYEQIRDETMQKVYSIISMHLGTPPKLFIFEDLIDAQIGKNKDKQKKLHTPTYSEVISVYKSVKTKYTPLEFYEELVKPYVNVNDFICLMDDPRIDRHPKGKTYTRALVGNVLPSSSEEASKRQVLLLNVEIEVMKEAAMRSIVEYQEAVWMGCEFSRNVEVNGGILDEQLFNLEQDVYAWHSDRPMNKAERLDFKHSTSTHAMVIVGVNVQERNAYEKHFVVSDYKSTDNQVRVYPDRWKVENSHGEHSGKKGYFVMMDNWFSENVYEIAVHKKVLPVHLRYEPENAIVLAPWDSMSPPPSCMLTSKL